MTSPTLPVLRVSSLSVEPVRVPVYATANGTAIVTTGFAVSMAFITPGTDPLVGNWISGTWDVGDSVGAQCNISGLAKGTYEMWIKILAATTIIKKFGTLVVY